MANGVNYLPSGFEPIAQGIQAIGAGLGQNLFPNEQRQMRLQDQIAENPELASRFATQIRRAGGAEAAAGALGLDVGFLQQIERTSPPGLDEQVETALMADPDAVPLYVKARIQEAKTAAATGEAQEATARGVTTFEQTKESLGNNAAQAHAERLGIDLQSEQGKLMMEQFSNYRQFIDKLPENQQGRFLASMFNPGFLQDIQFREDLSLRDHIAHLQAQATAEGAASMNAADLFGLYSKFQDQTSKAISDLMSATETGDKELIRVAEARINDLMRAAQATLPPGLVGTLFEATPDGKRTRFNIFDLASLTPEQKALMAIQGGTGTREDLFSSAYWQNLAPDKRKEIVDGLARQEALLADEDIESQFRRQTIGGGIEGSALEEILSGLAGAMRTGVDVQREAGVGQPGSQGFVPPLLGIKY